jgi:transcriptional regulator with XRE-family HTH domain/tetratricopeptide (TPR) repeat protein
MSDAFALLLRHHRLRCRLTQEALAERAGISSRSVREMERGRSPRPRTVDQLATALGLTGAEREEFGGAAAALFWAGREVPASAAVPRQLPADLPDFVGRADEFAELSALLTADGRTDVGEFAEHNAPLTGDGAELPALHAPLTGDGRAGAAEFAALNAPPTGDGRAGAGERRRGAPVAAISGPAGVGKTALAVHTAHRLADRFPGGQLYAALRGGTGPADPSDVLAQFLRALGVDGGALPAGVDARAALFRERLAGRPVLIVLDDAAGHGQLAPLLPAGGAAALVTSRLPMTGLPGVTVVDLAPLPAPAAVELLTRVTGAPRAGAEPAAAAEVVAACGGLPLAVRIAAARLAARPQWTIGALAERLADERRRLDELRHGDLAVRPGLQLGYRGLGEAAARAFVLLGGLGLATFPEWPVAALLGGEPAAGAAALDELLAARLVDDLGPDQAGQPRYRFHDLTALFARERWEAEVAQPERTAALARAASGWLALARRAQDGLRCERFHLDDRTVPATVADHRALAVAAGRPADWFEAEREALAVLVPACATAGLAAPARGLAGCAAEFYQLRAYYDDWRRSTAAALSACRRSGDRAGEAAMLRGLGSCRIELTEFEPALADLREARALATRIGDPAGAALAGKDAGVALNLSGRWDEAEKELHTAAAELAQAGRGDVRAMALTNLAFAQRQQGRVAEAVETARSAEAAAGAGEDTFVVAYASRGLAGALLAADRPGEAAEAARRAAEIFEQIGDPIGTAQSLRALGEALTHDPVRRTEAEQVLHAAATLFRERGNDWGLHLAELSLGELAVRAGTAGAADHLRRALRYFTDEQVPALRGRTLVALADAAEQAGDPGARGLLAQAHELYRELGMPDAATLAARLGRRPA